MAVSIITFLLLHIFVMLFRKLANVFREVFLFLEMLKALVKERDKIVERERKKEQVWNTARK